MARESLLEQAKESAAQTDDDDDGGNDGGNYESYPVVTQSPTTVITGTVEDIWFTGDIDAEEQSGDFGVRLSNPRVEEGDGEIIDGRDNDAGTDYKVFDPNQRDTQYSTVEIDGEEHTVGVESPNSSTYKGDFVDEFEEDMIDLYVGGGASNERLGRVLDVNGERSAHAFDGEYSGGLIEFEPGSGEGEGGVNTRVARPPVLRDDVEGEEITVLLAMREQVEEDYEGGGYWILINKDGEELTTQDGGVPEEYVNFEWHDQPQGGFFNGGSTEESDSGWDDDAEEVIEETVDYIESEGGDVGVFDDLEGHVEQNLDDAEEGEIQAVAGEIRASIEG